jgi:hypothetical protein
MTQDMKTETETEFRRAERAAGVLNDTASHQALRRYLTELEYDLVYRVPDRGPEVTI